MSAPRPLHDELRQWRRVDDLDRLHVRVHRAIRTAEKIMYHPSSETSDRLRACTTIVQAAHAAVKLHEARHLEARIERLEELHEALTANNDTTR
jgi:hypothetical protein